MNAGEILAKIAREVGVTLNESTVNGADISTVDIVCAINEAGNVVSKSFHWPKQQKSFTIAAGQSSAILPVDFSKIADGNAVFDVERQSHAKPVSGSGLWQMVKAKPSVELFYFLAGSTIETSRAAGVGGVDVHYTSNHWVVGKDAITDNADQFNIPEDVLFYGALIHWKRAKGLPFDAYQVQFDGLLARQAENKRA